VNVEKFMAQNARLPFALGEYFDRLTLGQFLIITQLRGCRSPAALSEMDYRTMNKRISARLNMAHRALEFSTAHRVDDAGYATSLKQLEEQLVRANQLAEEQSRGLAEVRSATEEKDTLKRRIRRSHLRHLARVAQKAATEVPELAGKFDLPRVPFRGLAFRAAARSMLEEAEQRKAVLITHGLVEPVLQKARESLDQLDAAVERGAQGRRRHIEASAALDVATDQAVQQVKILDGYNRVRFVEDPERLAGWIAASNIIGPALSGGQSVSRSRGTQSPSPATPVPPPAPGSIAPAA
jgi:hypothetical protein